MRSSTIRRPIRRRALVAVVAILASAGALSLGPSTANAGVVVGPPVPSHPGAGPCGMIVDGACSVTSVTFTHTVAYSLELGMYLPATPISLRHKISATYDLSCADGTHARTTVWATTEGGPGLSSGVEMLQAVPTSHAVTTCVVTQILRGTWLTSTTTDTWGHSDLVGFTSYPPLQIPWL